MLFQSKEVIVANDFCVKRRFLNDNKKRKLVFNTELFQLKTKTFGTWLPSYLDHIRIRTETLTVKRLSICSKFNIITAALFILDHVQM